MPRADPTERAAYQAAYGAANREKLLAQKADYRRANSVRMAALRAAYNETNPVPVMLYIAKARARRTGREFTITESDICVPDRCPVLDIPLCRGRGKAAPGSPSIERIDNRLGYVPGNVIVISFRANNLKGDATLDELIAIVNFYRWLLPHKGTMH